MVASPAAGKRFNIGHQLSRGISAYDFGNLARDLVLLDGLDRILAGPFTGCSLAEDEKGIEVGPEVRN